MNETVAPSRRTRSGSDRGRSRTAGIAVLLAAFVVGGFVGCSEEPSDTEAPVDPRMARIAEGKALYDANCLGCHWAGALGDGPLAAGLPVKPANILEHLGDHTDDDMVRRITEGIPPGMPPAPIAGNEVRQVMAYVWSLVPDSARPRLRALQATAEETH